MALIKKDTCAPDAPIVAWHRDGHFPGEPTFVGAPAAAGASAPREDDGALLSAVHDGVSGGHYLLVLNASDMRPLATLRAPDVGSRDSVGRAGKGEGETRILAFGLHGHFLDAAMQLA
jgi:carotenoid cleavage dioxygenase-like enzyme